MIVYTCTCSCTYDTVCMHKASLCVHNEYIITCSFHKGFTSNGEFNTLRCQGITRPLSVLKLRANVRVKYGTMRQEKMRAMLSPKRKYTCTLY